MRSQLRSRMGGAPGHDVFGGARVPHRCPKGPLRPFSASFSSCHFSDIVPRRKKAMLYDNEIKACEIIRDKLALPAISSEAGGLSFFFTGIWPADRSQYSKAKCCSEF